MSSTLEMSLHPGRPREYAPNNRDSPQKGVILQRSSSNAGIRSISRLLDSSASHLYRSHWSYALTENLCSTYLYKIG